MKDDGNMRDFGNGATRDTATGKLDYEGFLSPAVLEQYGRFMEMNRLQSDGGRRDSDNWQQGIPRDVYMKSAFRHFMEMWTEHRKAPGCQQRAEFMAGMCGLLFNVMGYMHEWLKVHDMVEFDKDEPTIEMRARREALK